MQPGKALNSEEVKKLKIGDIFWVDWVVDGENKHAGPVKIEDISDMDIACLTDKGEHVSLMLCDPRDENKPWDLSIPASRKGKFYFKEACGDIDNGVFNTEEPEEYKPSLNKMVHVYFAPGEGGKAEEITKDIVKVLNIPLTNRCNLYDICTVKRIDGVLHIDKVLSSHFECKIGITYKETHQFYQLAKLFTLCGCKVEGVYSPKDPRPGAMFVAYDPPVDPISLAEGIGVKQKKYE